MAIIMTSSELPELLGLPPEVVPVAVVPLGHLVKPLGPPRRLAAALGEDPLAELDDVPVGLQPGQEEARKDDPLVGVPPPK